MGIVTGVVASVVVGLVVGVLGAFTLVQVGSSSSSTAISAPLVQYGSR
jgi:hypothetical protein